MAKKKSAESYEAVDVGVQGQPEPVIVSASGIEPVPKTGIPRGDRLLLTANSLIHNLNSLKTAVCGDVERAVNLRNRIGENSYPPDDEIADELAAITDKYADAETFIAGL